MATNRRTFIKLSAAAGGACGMGITPLLAFGAEVGTRMDAHAVRRAAAPLRILILGGTGFTGPAQVRYALARGHSVTLFNRGKTRPGLFTGKVDELVGDLGGDASALKGRTWDVVIDNPTTAPYWVRNAGQYLKGNVGHYVFISTLSVYAANDTPNADESAATLPMPSGLDPYTTARENMGQHYGELKAYSEQEVARTYPGHYTIVRPGLIVGPDDPSDRFTYWPVRVDRGGEVMAPGTPNDVVQFIDARDLAEWTIRMVETQTGGVYNATGPRTPLSLAEFMYGLKAVTASDPHFVWVPADFLATEKIRAWRDMPVWIAPGPATAGFSRRSIEKALAKGLTFRPLALTANDTIDWNRTRPQAAQDTLAAGAVAGVSAEREAQVLADWRAKVK